MTVKFEEWIDEGVAEAGVLQGDEKIPVIQQGKTKYVSVSDLVKGAVFQLDRQDYEPPFTTSVEADDPNTPTNWVTVREFITASLPLGEYQAFAQIGWTLDVATKRAYFRFLFDDIESPIVKDELKDTNEFVLTNFIGHGTLDVVETHNMKIQALISAGGGAATLSVGRTTITIERKK